MQHWKLVPCVYMDTRAHARTQTCTHTYEFSKFWPWKDAQDEPRKNLWLKDLQDCGVLTLTPATDTQPQGRASAIQNHWLPVVKQFVIVMLKNYLAKQHLVKNNTIYYSTWYPSSAKLSESFKLCLQEYPRKWLPKTKLSISESPFLLLLMNLTYIIMKNISGQQKFLY